MIKYTEKGAGMHEALAAAGLILYQLDGEWVTDSDPEQVQAFIDSYVPPREALLQPINERCAQLLAAVKAGIPEEEVMSWGKQEAEARAGGGPLTVALATSRGVPLNVLLGKIIQKADAYAAYSGQIIGTRQALEDLVDAGEVDVSWPAEL